LNFKYHVEQISKKVSYALFSLRAVKNFLPRNTMLTLYYALVHCHFNYASEIWCSAPQSCINKLYLLQKKAVRLICDEKYNAHSEPLFKKLEILKITDMISLSKLKFMHQYSYNNLPISFLQTWATNQERRDRNTNIPAPLLLRNNDDLYEPLSRLEHVSKFPLYNFPKIWNSVPRDVKSISNFNSFSKCIKANYLFNYDANFRCTRLFCLVCNS
jgi:hypothetical protein